MTKYIHYCWFGGKPLPKLAKKCIESWKKYLPDYELKEWNESNSNVEECPFIKGAYENKKWAFVADYVRTKALKEYGGIYFDTDMEILKNIDKLLEENSFLGIEDSGYVAVGVWYEKEKNAFLPTELLKKYQEIEKFNVNKLTEISIPKLISGILSEYGLIKGSKKIQNINGVTIYPRDYFYPYSYDRSNNSFSENTCMIHYYDASWVPLKDRIENNMLRKLGQKKTFFILNSYRKSKNVARKCVKICLYPIVVYRNVQRKKARITTEYINRVNNTIKLIGEAKTKSKEYIVLHNSSWMGITNATLELFDNTIDCGEIYRKSDIVKIGTSILNNNIKQVIFSSFAIGYKDLAIYLKRKNPNIKIKTYWHGSHSQVLDAYGFERNVEIINLHRKGIVDIMATCKKSLVNFYKKEGFKAAFITNKVETSVKAKNKKNKNEVRIGLYAAKCDDWRKNMYSQMAAASLIPNAVLDMVPLNESAIEFAKIINLKLDGVEKPLSREKLLERMSQNDINLYVTYSECAPMLPLESFEMGVPCITGNNHHYFENTELEKYLVVNNEENPIEIKNKIEMCLKRQEKVFGEYNKFRENNLKEARENIKDFFAM